MAAYEPTDDAANQNQSAAVLDVAHDGSRR